MKLGFTAGTFEVDRFGGEKGACNTALLKEKENIITLTPYVVCKDPTESRREAFAYGLR